MTTVQKRLLSLLGSVVLLGALGAYAYFGTYEGKKKEEEQKQKEEKVASFTLGDVKQVRLLNKGVTYEMIGDGEGERKWRITKPLETLAERSTIEGLISHFADMKRKRAIDFKPEDLKSFGLEPPQASVSFKTGDKETQFLVGKKNTFDDSIYLLREGDKQVAMVPGALTYQSDRDLFQLREKRVVVFEDKDVQRIDVELNGKLAYSLERKGDEWMLGADTKADKAQVSTVLSTVRTLRAKSFPVETLDAKEAGKYGLDKPAAVLTMTLGNAKARIVFGDTKEQHYARIEGPVFELNESVAKKLDISPAELRDKTVLTFARDDIKKIKLAETGKDFVMLEKKDTWEMVAPEQKPANDAKVSNLLYKLSTLKAKSILAEKITPELKKKHGLDPVAKQITLYKADGTEAGTIVIGNADGELVALTTQGRERLDGVEKTQLTDLSFEAKDYVKEEAKVATTPGTPAGQ